MTMKPTASSWNNMHASLGVTAHPGTKCRAAAIKLLDVGHKFELAILDYHMPDTDGLELAAR